MNNVRRIPVKTASASYEVLPEKGMLSSLKRLLKVLFPDKDRKFFVTTSPEIWALWSQTFLKSFSEEKPTVLFLPAGEKHKRLAQVEELAMQLSAAGADRSSVLLAFGGGVIGDVTGFLAAIYMRGIDYVQVPTTLLAQVDSSVGGKTGVNLKSGKNLIGAFHHPKAVVIDVETLATLPESELRAGLFESIKAGLIRDRALFNLMERERTSILSRDPALLERVITASVRMKAAVVGEDERESGLRMILNFGHTVGHAIEAVAGYGKLLHGEAVGWGMLAALEISRLRGLPAKDYMRATVVIRAYGLPPLPALSAEKLVEATGRDKKNTAGMRRFVLLRSLGDAYVTDTVTNDELATGISAILSPAQR
jgi:3-dehydroquinate synthase